MQDAELDALKSDENKLRKELESAGVQFRGRYCRCPFHDDRSPSAGIFTKDGVWFFKCQVCGVGGTIIDIRAKLNKRTPADEIRAMNDRGAAPARQHRTPTKQEKQYKIYPTLESIRDGMPHVAPDTFTTFEGMFRYTDPQTGIVDLAVLRFRDKEGKKHFLQCSPTAGGYWLKAPDGKLPIYNRSRIAKAEYVVVVEGEKCVHSLQEIGIVATTNPGGALKAANADWSPLAGKRVYTWRDFDAINLPDKPYPGERTGYVHMQQVEGILQQVTPAPEVLKIDVEKLELPEKGDAADFVDRYAEWAPEEVRGLIEAEVLADAEPVGIAADYAKYMEAGIAGGRRSIPFPWKHLTYCSRALGPGMVTCWVGDPGCGKSLGIVQCLTYWLACDVRACAYMLEDERNDHLARAHAQIELDSRIADEKWLEENAWFARESFKKCRQQIEEIGRCIWDAPDDQVSLEMLAVWVEERAKAGYRIIVIDPVTAAAAEKNPWSADCTFIFRVKTTARRYGCSVILVVHPRKGQKINKKTGGDLDDMAGGAAYGRFSHTTIWWEMHERAGGIMVRPEHHHQAEEMHFNRAAKVAKARRGPGHKKRIAFDFHGKSLTFSELGLIEQQA